ncbi:MAG: TAXI family TRAP transporter solute-binding subunit [Thermodesulfobacteriota bacterium]
MDFKRSRKMMVNVWTISIIWVMLVIGISASAEAQIPKKKLTMGTCPSASGMYPWLVAHGTIINQKVGELSVTTTESPGGVRENQKRINAGEMDFGWGCTCSVWHNIEGTLMWKDNKRDDLRMLAIVIEVPVTWFVRADSGVTTLYELEGKPFGTGVPGSVTAHKNRALLDSLGIKPKFFEAPLGAQVQAVRDGRIIGLSKTGAPDSMVLDIAATIPIRLLNLSEEDFAKAQKKYPIEFPLRGTIPAGSYPGQNKDFFTYSDSYGWTTSNRLPEEVGYKIVKTWYETRYELGKMYSSANNPVTGELDFPKLTIRALKETQIKLHAGAVKFFKEIGLSIPNHLIPPEVK